MRELKFRALFEHITSGEKIWQTVYLAKGQVVNPLSELRGYVQTTEWLQFAGRKDGVDIYEGDIVKYLIRADKTSGGRWHQEVVSMAFSYPLFLKNYFATNYQIAGNTYENPELLEGKT
jgi:hypothetical protein